MIVKSEDLFVFLYKLAAGEPGDFYSVWVPVKSSESGDGEYFYASLAETDENTDVTIDGYRTVDPIKMFYYRFREKVLPTEYPSVKQVVMGVKACDLQALALMDRALMNESFVDPAYRHWRESITVVSADCTDLAASCHCILSNGVPYPETGYDVNLSAIDDSYVVTTGSEKGRDFVSLLKKEIPWEEASPEHLDRVNQRRQDMVTGLHEANEPYFRPDSFTALRSADLDRWEDESTSCVGCGACTNICPSCYCLILNDESTADQFTKIRTYDSCQLFGYARVAGGATPRPQMTQRFRHRYLCKFTLMPGDFDMLGCTGCGRCVDACPGNIDIRSVLKNIMDRSAKELEATPVETM